MSVVYALRSLAEWQRLAARYPSLQNAAHATIIAEYCRIRGVNSPFLGRIGPEHIEVNGKNYREQLFALGLNSRLRAVLDYFSLHPASRDTHSVRIFGHEALTKFALVMRGRYPKYLGSEFAADADGARALFPIPVVDITRSTLPDGSFEFVMSNEVLEHVPNLTDALIDTHRILRPGGQLIATFPFSYNEQSTAIKATIVNGQIIHYDQPEYHGNPVIPEKGSLVFQIPGWDIVHLARRVGFRDAFFVFMSSRRQGITGAEIAGIFIFVAER